MIGQRAVARRAVVAASGAAPVPVRLGLPVLLGALGACTPAQSPAEVGAARAPQPGAAAAASAKGPALAGPASSAGPPRWPEGRRAAVSLTYDDAIATQRTLAAEQLAAHGISATFFLKGASEDLAEHRAEWMALAAAGHELASHTMHHPCDRQFDWVPQGYAIQDYDLARMEAELSESRLLLEGLGAPAPHTFAYPCGETGVGESRESYVPLVAQQFFAARGGGERFADPSTAEAVDVGSFDGAKPGAELVALVERAEQEGAWLVFTFHGVGGDYLAVDGAAHEALLAALEERSARLWVAPFRAVAQHVFARQPGAS